MMGEGFGAEASGARADEASSGGSTSFSKSAYGAGVIGNVLGGINQAFEMQRQYNYQKNVLENNIQMLEAYRVSATRDMERRAAIMSGHVYAVAGHSGVSASSGSVVNAAADILAKAEVDKARLAFQVENQIKMARYQQNEMTRRSKKGISDAFVGGALQLAGAGASMGAGGAGG